MSDEPMMPDLGAPAPQTALSMPAGWSATLHRGYDGGLSRGHVEFNLGHRGSSVAFAACISRPDWDPRDPDDADAVFALLDAGVLRHGEWLTEPEVPAALAGNRALRAMREVLASDRAPPAQWFSCAICASRGQWTRGACEHVAAAARATLAAVRADPAMRLEAAGLIAWRPPDASYRRGEWVIARAHELLRGRVTGRATTSGSVRREVYFSPGAERDLVGFACEAWDVERSARAPRPSRTTIVVDPVAPEDDRWDVPFALPPRG